MHIINLKKFIIVFINLVTLTIQSASGFLYLAPPGAEEVYLFQDIAERDIYEIEVDLTLGDVELVGLSILEIMDTYADRKLFLSCEPKTKEEALIAMQLGFITPRTNKELEKVQHIGFNNSVSLEQIVTLAGKELDPKSAESKGSQRFTQESKVHTLEFLKQKKVKLGTYICEEIELVTSDNYSTNAVANSMSKCNIQQFKEGIKKACVLDFFMVLMDDECTRILVSNLSGEEHERENLASRLATVEENYADTIAYDKAKFGKEQIQHVREFLEGDHNFLTASIKELDEKGLLEYISSAQGYIVFCDEAIRNPVLKDKKDEVFFAQKMKEIAEQCITNAAVALALGRFEHNNIDGAEEALKEYCPGDHQDKTQLLVKIQQVRKQQEEDKIRMHAELREKEIQQLLEARDLDEAYTKAHEAMDEFPQYEGTFKELRDKVEKAVRAKITYWISEEQRDKLLSYGKKIDIFKSRKPITAAIGISFMAQKDSSLRKKALSQLQKQKQFFLDMTQVCKDFARAIMAFDKLVWEAIDTQAKTFKDSLVDKPYWPKKKDDLEKLIPLLSQYEKMQDYEIAINVMGAYVDAVEFLYNPRIGIINHALSQIKQQVAKDTHEEPAVTGKEEVEAFLTAVRNFRKKHGELSLKGKNADKEAKDFIAILLNRLYEDMYIKIQLSCLKHSIEADAPFLNMVLHNVPIEVTDYLTIVDILEKTEALLEVWKNTQPEKEYTVTMPWQDLTAWDTNAPEMEIPDERPWRRKLYYKIAQVLLKIIEKAHMGEIFNRYPVTIDNNGRIADPDLLVILPILGFKPYIKQEGFYELLQDPEACISVEVLPPVEDHPPELIINFNAEKGFVFIENHLGYSMPEGEDSKLRIILSDGNNVDMDIASYENLREGNKLKYDTDGRFLLVKYLSDKRAYIAMQHYFVDYQSFYDVFIAYAGKGDLKHTCAKKLRKVKQEMLRKIYKVTDVMLKPKERLIRETALEKAAGYTGSGNFLQALRVVREGLRNLPADEEILKEKKQLEQRMRKDTLIKRAGDAIDRGSLKSMKKAQEALERFYLEPDQEVNKESMSKATEGASEAFLAWWNLQAAIDEEKERLEQIRQCFIFASGLVEDKNFELARAEVDAAGALGADFRYQMAALYRIEKEKQEYTAFLSNKRDMQFIGKRIEGLNDIEDLNDLNGGLKNLKVSFSEVPQYESKLNDEAKTLQGKLDEKLGVQTSKVAENSKDIERQIQEIQTTINQEEDINKLLTAKEKISQITKVLSPELIPSQLARDRFFTICRKLGRELYQKKHVVVFKNKENFRVGLIDLRADINKAETIEQLKELEKNFEDLRKNFEAIRQKIDVAKFQEIFKEIKLKLNMRIKIADLRIKKDQEELKAILEKISVNDEEIFKDFQARKRFLEGKIKALVALKERIAMLPSQKVKEELIGKVDKVLQAKNELLGKIKYKANQLKLIEDIKTEIKQENLIEGILEWPIFGKNGLITQNIKPEQLAQRVYKLIDKLDLAIEESKNFYDNIDAQMKEVVKLKNDEIEQAKAELKEKPKTPELKEAFHPGKKSLSKFDQEFIVLVVNGILDVRVKRLAKDLLSSRLTGDEHKVETIFNKIVHKYLAREIMLPGLQGVNTIMIHLKNDVFLEIKELCELIQGKHSDIDQAMKALLIARFKKDAKAESKAGAKLRDLLKKQKGLKIPESKNYQAFLSWHPEADISKIVEALKLKLTPEISEKSTRFIDTAQ